MRKRLLSTLLVLCMVLALLPRAALAANGSHPFTDVVETVWYSSAVQYVYEHDMMVGTSDTEFSPDIPTSRGMIITILHRMEGTPSASGMIFADVPMGQWYTDAVAWASANAIVSGYGNGNFGPDDSITREQLASILYRYAEYKGYDTTTVDSVDTFSDRGQISPYAVDAMNWAVGVNLIAGMGDNTLAPGGFATRAQAAAILMRFCENIVAGWVSEADNFYGSVGGIVDTFIASTSEDVLTEKDAQKLFSARGFTDYPVTYAYTLSGEYVDETEVSAESNVKHPMYKTYYVAEDGTFWYLYIIDNDILAAPITFNVNTGVDYQLIVTEEETITSYVGNVDKFYVTIPNSTAVFKITVDRIAAATLDELTLVSLCERTGEAMPDSDDIPVYNEDEIPDDVTPQSDVVTVAVEAGDLARMDSNGKAVIVALGDSFSSGESIIPFIGQQDSSGRDLSIFEKTESLDWLAHRSTKGWPTMLEVPNKEVDLIFKAASGAETVHYWGVFNKPYHKDYRLGLSTIPWHHADNKDLPPQQDTFNGIGKTVDYVTMSLGGNDAGFVPIIINCVLEPSYLTGAIFDTTILEVKLAETIANAPTILDKLKDVYVDIHKQAPYAKIIIAGYPELLNKDGKGITFSKREATDVNKAVAQFNGLIENAVKECRDKERIPIYFVDVMKTFNSDGGHQAFCDDEWINEIKLLQSEDLNDHAFPPTSSYSMHPNENGAKAYARCVNAEIARLEKEDAGARSISGVITIADEDANMTNNMPLAGASIELTWYDPAPVGPNPNYSTVSDVDGTYSISNVVPGRYNITVSKDGYLTVTDIVTISNEEGTYYNVTLTEESEDKNKPQINYYEVFDGIASSWEEAERYCESLGGHLATLTSKEENDHVYQIMRNAGYKSAYFGFTDKDVEGTWTWVTGETVAYMNWHSREPSNGYAGENYAMFYYQFSDGTWNDGDFGGRTDNGGTAFICEWDTEAAYQSYLSRGNSENTSYNIFEHIPSEFEFSSGAGAWGTVINLNNDGSFSGQYYDADMGVTGPKYPDGTVYICNFTGKFTTPKKVNEYIYSMNLESLNAEGNPGTVYYEDNIRYIVSDPYGFEDADEFLIYLPGCPLEDTSEEFISWSFINPQIRNTIPAGVYGIYNVGGMEGFMAEDDNTLWKKRYAYSYNSYRSELWPSYYSKSHLEFWPEFGAATLGLSFDWAEDKQTEFIATDSRGTGQYSISLDFNKDLSSVVVTVQSMSGHSLKPWGGTADGTLSAEYRLK